jgi:hypothetical protein
MFPQGLHNINHMPIPERIDRIDRLDGAFYLRASWTLCRVVWPQRCRISGRGLWPGTLAYRGRAVWTGPGKDAVEDHWHDRNEHLIWQLKE